MDKHKRDVNSAWKHQRLFSTNLRMSYWYKTPHKALTLVQTFQPTSFKNTLSPRQEITFVFQLLVRSVQTSVAVQSPFFFLLYWRRCIGISCCPVLPWPPTTVFSWATGFTTSVHLKRVYYRQTSYTSHTFRQNNCWSLRCSWSIACRRCSN